VLATLADAPLLAAPLLGNVRGNALVGLVSFPRGAA